MQEQKEIIKKLYTQRELMTIFPFGKSKFYELLGSNVLPVIKVGRDYITTEKVINDWIQNNLGKEIFYK